jgi:hypothetical protein
VPPPPRRRHGRRPRPQVFAQERGGRGVFTHAKYMSKAKEHLARHLARQNPCDGSVAEYVYKRRVTGTVPNIETLDLTGLVEALDGNIRFIHVTSFVFRFLNDLNTFAVVPNVKVNEVYFVTDDGALMCTRLAEFVIEFWHKSVTREERFRTRSNMGNGAVVQRQIAFQSLE